MTHSPGLLDISIFQGQREEVPSGSEEHATLLFENKRLDYSDSEEKNNTEKLKLFSFSSLETQIFSNERQSNDREIDQGTLRIELINILRHSV